MNLSWFSKFEGQMETLKLKSDPLYHGLGIYEDTDGNKWDVVCVIGADYCKVNRPYINARKVDNSPYYSTATNSHQNGLHTWKPYFFEVIKETVVV